MNRPLIRQLRDFAANRTDGPRDFASWFGYMTPIYVAVYSRLESLLEWYDATDDDRRMFLLLVAHHIETYWED